MLLLFVFCIPGTQEVRHLDYLIGSESHSLAMVRGISLFSSLQRGQPKHPQGEDGYLLPLFSFLDLSLLSSYSGNHFLLTQEPASEPWDSLHLCPHFSSSTSFITESLRGHPRIPHVFILLIPGPLHYCVGGSG